MRLEHINTINSIVRMAEDEIQQRTGLKMRVLLLDNSRPFDTSDAAAMKLLQIVANALSMLSTDYGVKKQTRDYSELRQLGCLFLRQYFPKMKLFQLAVITGYSRHSAVLLAIKTANERLETRDEVFCWKYNLIKNALNQWQREQTTQLNSN